MRHGVWTAPALVLVCVAIALVWLVVVVWCVLARLTARDGSAYRRPRLRLGVERAKVTDLTPDAYRAWRQILED